MRLAGSTLPGLAKRRLLRMAPQPNLTPRALVAHLLYEACEKAKREATQLPTWTPQAGPQTDLFACEADEILYGGAAGGGKSSAAVAIPSQRIKRRGYRALILRRSTPDLKGLIDEAKAIYQDGRPTGKFAFAPFAPGDKARFRGDVNWLLFPAWGTRIEFGHCHNVDDYRPHMGQQYDDIIFDEGTQFTRQQYENIITRRRGTVPGIRRRAIVTANPPEQDEPGEEWVRQKWAPWIDPACRVDDWEGLDEGGLDARGDYVPPQPVRLKGLPQRDAQAPASSGQILYVAKDSSGHERFSAEPFVWNGVKAHRRTFIRSMLRDNPAMLEAEPNYAQILRQADAVRAKQLEEGDWTIRLARGDMFQRSWFGEPIDPHDVPRNAVRVRAWDLAGTVGDPDLEDGPAWTVGVRMAATHDTFYVEHVVRIRSAPGDVDNKILELANSDGYDCTIRLPQDPGQAGKSQAARHVSMLSGFHVIAKPVTGDKVTRARPASSQANPISTGGNHGRIRIVRGDWNEAFLKELEAFPKGRFKDQVDAFADAFNEVAMRAPGSDDGPSEPIDFDDDYRFGDQRGFG